MKVTCQHCGARNDIDQKDMYHYVHCQSCGKGFVAGVSSNTTNLTVQRQSASDSTNKIPSRFMIPPANGGSKLVTHSKQCVVRRVSVALCLALIISSLVCGGAYCAYLHFGDMPRLNRGCFYYANGLYEKAYKLLLPLANKGYARAQLLIGDCNANGQGVFLDMEEAVKWYRAAADIGLPEAQYRMFKCSLEGAGVEYNLTNAAKWCRKAADAGFEEAIYDMGMLYIDGIGVKQNYKSAVKWFQKGAVQNNAKCLYMLGQCYELGHGVDRDEDEAAKWQNMAVAAWQTQANAGDTTSMILLAELYKNGDVVELDKEESVNWYRKAAELGNASAQFGLAVCYFEGIGTIEDKEEAAKWMLKSAEQGSISDSQWLMGRFYEDGIGVEINVDEAVKWFQRASKKGSNKAQYSLAMCYLHGNGVVKDENAAELLLEKAAKSGNDNARKELDRIRKEREYLKRAREEERIRRQLEAEQLAEKEWVIAEILDIEKEIESKKEFVNNIFAGKIKGDWNGFDSTKIAMTDPSVSVTLEEPLQKYSASISTKDAIDALNEVLSVVREEKTRLENRIEEITHVKSMYDAKELESRKEICTSCKGNGHVQCARCKGRGTIVDKEKVPCPTCREGYFSQGRGAGKVKVYVKCGHCRGTGQVQSKCNVCGGKRKVWREESGRLPTSVRCSACNGSGKGYPELCPICSGFKQVEKWQTCETCKGSGLVVDSNKITCPVCEGMSQFTCKACDGKGFIYRAK